MAADSAMALDEFSTSLRIMNAHPLHSIAKAIELMSLPAADVESCAFVFVAVVLLMQIHFREFPVFMRCANRKNENEKKIMFCAAWEMSFALELINQKAQQLSGKHYFVCRRGVVHRWCHDSLKVRLHSDFGRKLSKAFTKAFRELHNDS